MFPDTSATCAVPIGPPLQITGAEGDQSNVGILASAGTYEPHLLRLLARVVGEDAVCVDIGANIGIISSFLGRLCPHGAVYSFEPVPESRSYLVRNLSANHVENVTVYEYALSDTSGSVSLNYLPGFTAGAWSSTLGVTEPAGRSVIAPTITLDDWVASQGLARLDIIKMDIEGAELPALTGARTTISTLRPDLVVELNPVAMRWLNGRSWRDLVEAVDDIYPHVYYIRSDGSVVQPLGTRHYERLLGAWGHLDLYCTFRSPDDMGKRPMREFVRRGNDARRSWAAMNRWRRPRRCYVFDPDLDLRIGVSEVHGRPTEVVEVPLTVHNRSGLWLSSDFDISPVYASYRTFDRTGSQFLEYGSYTRLRRPLGPGRRTSLKVEVTLPAQSGEYRLLPTFIQHDFLWLDELVPGRWPTIPMCVE